MGTRQAKVTLMCAGCRLEVTAAARNTNHGKRTPAFDRHFAREAARVCDALGWASAGERLYCPSCRVGRLTVPKTAGAR